MATSAVAARPEASCKVERVGEYQLLRRIGRGGMAEVWAARREGLGDPKYVAVKLMAGHHLEDERFERMFRAEAAVSACLSHANIVQVFDAGEVAGRPYLVMEWVDGVTLAELEPWLWRIDPPRRHRLAGYIIGQLLHALDYAHRITDRKGAHLGIVHRDVSPHNVLVSISGEVKLTDFGVAHRMREQSSGTFVKGKLRYMPREQVQGNGRTAAVDLFAVGAILHELLDGRPFRHLARDDVQLYAAVMSGSVPELGERVPPPLRKLRARLLAPDPRRRLSSAARALDLLEEWPDYVDLRRELGNLCASFMGVTGPRAGPLTHPPGGALRPVTEILPGSDAAPDPHALTSRTGMLHTLEASGNRLAPPRHGPTEPTVTLPRASRPGAGIHTRTSSLRRGVLAVVAASGVLGAAAAFAHPVSSGSWMRRWWTQWAPISILGNLARPVLDEHPPIEENTLEQEDAAQPSSTPRTRRSGSAPRPRARVLAMEVPSRPSTRAPTQAKRANMPEPLSQPHTSAPEVTDGPLDAAPARDTALVHLRLHAIERASLQIGEMLHEVTPGRALRLGVGRHQLAWRIDPTESWREQTIDLEPGEWVLRLGTEGVQLLDLRTVLHEH